MKANMKIFEYIRPRAISNDFHRERAIASGYQTLIKFL